MKTEKMKNLVYKIVESETKKHQIKVTAYPTTQKENLYRIITTKLPEKYTTYQEKINDIIEEIKFNYRNGNYGYCTPKTNEIIILLDQIQKLNSTNTKEQTLYILIKSTYHELKHLISDKFRKENPNDIITFYLDLETLILLEDYKKDTIYNNLYEEIIADKYGIEQTTKLLKKATPKTYEKIKLYISLEELLNNIYYQNYDSQLIIDYLNDLSKDRKLLQIKKYPSKTIKNISNEDGTFKNITTLFQENNDNTLPIEAKYLIISSATYLNNINYQNITKEELLILSNAIDYTYHLEKQKELKNNELRTILENLSKNIKTYDELEIYIQTLLTLNEKETNNQNKLIYLTKKREEVTNLLSKDQLLNKRFSAIIKTLRKKG